MARSTFERKMRRLERALTLAQHADSRYDQARNGPRPEHVAYWEFRCKEYLPNDRRTRRAFERAIETRQTIGICVKGHRAMYDGTWGFLSCNDIFVNGLQLPSPAVFVLAGLDPVAMQEIYFHWQMPTDADTPEHVVKEWMHRRRQAFTDLLPFAFVHWERKHTGVGDPHYEELGTYRKDFRSPLTVRQALSECQHFPEEEEAVA